MLRSATTLLFILFFSFIANSQTGYVILRDHNLPVSEIKPYSDNLKVSTKIFLDSLHNSDQDIRHQTYEMIFKQLRITDSLNFLKYRSYFEKTGYLSFDKRRLENDQIDINRLLLSNYVLNIHFSDRTALPLIDLIIRSFPQKTCNENDLMNYFVTYLWRKTEFIGSTFATIPYHIILMPDLDSGKYSRYFKYAYKKYMEHCVKRDPSFLHFYLSGVSIKKGKINWNKYQVQEGWCGIFQQLIHNTVGILRYCATFLIKDANAFEIPDGMYSILFCTHPDFIGNPLYMY